MKIIRSVSFFILCFAVLLLSGCAAFLTHNNLAISQKISWRERQRELLGKNHWQICGTISIETKQQNFKAYFYWKQEGKSIYQITLFGPLALHAIILKGLQGKVSLEETNRPVVYGKNSEQLLQREVGFFLPVSDLYYWMRGLPVPRIFFVKQLDAFNRLLTLYQQQWTINYKNYIHANGIDFPGEIEFHGSSLDIRIIITSWN